MHLKKNWRGKGPILLIIGLGALTGCAEPTNPSIDPRQIKLTPISDDLLTYNPEWAEGIPDNPNWTEDERADAQEGAFVRNVLRNDETVIKFKALRDQFLEERRIFEEAQDLD